MWEIARNNGMDETSFMTDFLKDTDFSEEILLKGNDADEWTAIDILLSTKIENLVDIINRPLNPIYPESIVQFSTFDHALFTINKILHFKKGCLTFSEIGKEIINASQDGACKKYGENHSKVAAMLSLVTLKKEGQLKVSNSSLGNVSLSLEKCDKYQLAKRLSLRNSFIQNIISKAKNGDCNYMALAQQYLSESTAIRRRSNVKFIVQLILEGTSYEFLLKNIVW